MQDEQPVRCIHSVGLSRQPPMVGDIVRQHPLEGVACVLAPREVDAAQRPLVRDGLVTSC